MSTEPFLSIPNWDELQHYKDRSPPWIKLQNALLEDYKFECLPDASKAHLICIMLLASRINNCINPDPRWIARKIGANSKVDIGSLIDSGFLQLNQPIPSMGQDASNPVADSLPRGEKRREEESRVEKTKVEWLSPDWLNKKAWAEFEAHRKEIKKPLTDLSRTKAANSLEHFTEIEQQSFIDTTIQNRWTGIFPKKLNGNSHEATKSNNSRPESNLARLSRKLQADIAAEDPFE